MHGYAPLGEYLRFAVTLTAVLDPFLAVPIFVSLTAQRSEPERTQLARVVTLTVFLVLAGAALFGEALLTLIGASLPAFRVGGGLVLLLMALAMLNARVGGVRQSAAEAEELETGEVSGVVPLAVPLLAGPGAISTTIIAAQARSLLHLAAIVGCIAAVCALLWLVMRFAHALAPRMGTTGLNIATRLLGLLLTAIAIQTMAEGLVALMPGLR
ncbi:MAG TPA: NAAT family transporter [Burkholderiales bacterium]|nr:NAAT family transporter [Burkholderiales bacterium]